MSNFDMICQEFDRIPAYDRLFDDARTRLPAISANLWYIPILSTLITGRHPSTAATELYRFLLKQAPAEFDDISRRTGLHKRLRELIIQIVPITGVVKALEAALALNYAVPESERDSTFSRNGWAPENTHTRASQWLRSIYPEESDFQRQSQILAGDPTFQWLVIDVCYGLFLSDRSEISGLESELMVASSLMAQGLPRESLIHMRALRHLGLKTKELEDVRFLVKKTLEFMGQEGTMRFVPSTTDVEESYES